MSTIVVRYTPTADRADENQALVESVFAELAATDPGGLRYATYRLADGTFVHIADIEGDVNPLASNDAFARFQEGIGDRCAPGQGPNPQDATLVGSYRFLSD
jgi:acyl dehydratase